MDPITAIMTIISPYAASYLTDLFKRARFVEFAQKRKALLRAFVAFVSAVTAILTAGLNGEPISEDLLTVAVQTFLVFFATSGLYFFRKSEV